MTNIIIPQQYGSSMPKPAGTPAFYQSGKQIVSVFERTNDRPHIFVGYADDPKKRLQQLHLPLSVSMRYPHYQAQLLGFDGLIGFKLGQNQISVEAPSLPKEADEADTAELFNSFTPTNLFTYCKDPIPEWRYKIVEIAKSIFPPLPSATAEKLKENAVAIENTLRWFFPQSNSNSLLTDALKTAKQNGLTLEDLFNYPAALTSLLVGADHLYPDEEVALAQSFADLLFFGENIQDEHMKRSAANYMDRYATLAKDTKTRFYPDSYLSNGVRILLNK